MFYNAKDNEEEASSGHKGELALSYSSDSSDDKYGDHDRTGAKEKNYNSNINGASSDNDVDGRNNGAGGGFAEWLRFLISSVRTETLDAMANAKVSSSTALRKTKLAKSNSKIAWEGKTAQKLVKKLSKSAGIINRGFTEGPETTISREAISNSRRACENS